MELERIVGKALAKAPAERYQHVEDLLVDLRVLGRKLSTGKSKLLPRAAAPTRARSHMIQGLLGCYHDGAAGARVRALPSGPTRPVQHRFAVANQPARRGPARVGGKFGQPQQTGPGIPIACCVSPDGATIVYTSNKTGEASLRCGVWTKGAGAFLLARWPLANGLGLPSFWRRPARCLWDRDAPPWSLD